MTRESAENIVDHLEREAACREAEQLHGPRGEHPINPTDITFEEFDFRVRATLSPEGHELIYDRSAAWRAYEACIFDSNRGKVRFFNRSGDLISTTLANFVGIDGARTFGPLVNPDAQRRLYEKARSDTERSAVSHSVKFVCKEFESLIRVNRQVESLDIKVDMFADTPTIRIDRLTAYVTLRFDSLTSKIGSMRANEALVDRYVREHFPEFFEFLDFIAAARFAADRRRAFLWLHKHKDWGKGFLLDALRSLGLVLEVSVNEIDKAFAGDPVGVQGAEALRAWILFVDEFKAVTSEFKQLNNHMMLSPKHELRIRVPVYAKLFASAESVASLVNEGVEGQFADRFSVLSASSSDGPLSRLFGPCEQNLDYFEAVVVAAARHLDKRVSEYRALGREGANAYANATIEQWRAKRGIDLIYSSLEESIEEHATRIRQHVEEWAQWRDDMDKHDAANQEAKAALARQQIDDASRAQAEARAERLARPCEPDFLASTRPFKEVLQRCARRGFARRSVGRHAAVLIKNPQMVVEAYLAAMIPEGQRKKVRYKTQQIVDKLCDVDRDMRGRVVFYRFADAASGEQTAGVLLIRKF